ncbi:MAG TPA: BREX-1 system adenine-specific DNA-methyltransferase PglX, partial [Verrucomicrobiae bacterium]|nr:BREX-1 system adenine-specific DNA-methyltransferase PglX [Verrucomicrobiae bacterium]
MQELFGIQPTGAIADLARLTHLTDEQREVGRLLRERIAHLQAGHPNTGTKSATTAAESVQRVIREQAFTVLNRLAALRLSEERGLLIECVRQGFNSEGFQLFRQSAGNALGNTYETYMTYLERLFDELASELGMLFDRFSPMGLLFPRQDALQAILAELNGAGATAAREKLGPDDFARLWQADETIGWIYQYWNDPAERRKMRDESAAPRNSRELAVRNQFFTPRYVVEFLTDNTLGRIWYEMTGGETRLKEQCRYLVRRPNEIFLKEGETAPEQPKQDNLSQEELLKQPVYIPHRPLKDPRTILMLDPACGSMHFGLYAFDLFEVIYEEAWDLAKSGEIPPGADESFSEFCDLISEASLPTSSGKSIHSSIHPTIRSKEEFLRQVPRLTIEYNLHGIDIDPRCAQIAGLSLWLRAQKSWQRLNLKHAERPTIKRSNIVCAEPMPGEKELMKEFVEREFPIEERPIFLRLLQTIFDKMQLAGEAGSLLKIEEEIKTAIEGARQQWQAGRERPEFFDPAQIAKLDNRGGAQQELSAAPLLPSSKITTEQFWEQLEQRIYAALRHYAEHVENGGSFQRRLFAEDTARGFAFIDICRKHYDVVGMNPPFGERPETCENYLQRNYAETVGDFFSMFYERALLLAGSRGKVGAITNRTWLGLPTFEAFRKNVFGKLGCIEVAADLGSFVLDAQVETAAAIIDRNLRIDGRALWVRLLKTKSKEAALLQALTSANLGHRHETVFVASQQDFAALPTSAYGYWMSKRLIALYGPENSIGVRAAEVKQGTATADDFRFLRLAWEIPVVTIGLTSDWAPFAKGGEYSRFFDDIHLMICWKGNGREVDAFPGAYIRNSSFYGLPGITWPRRTTSPFGPRAFPAGCAFGDKGPVAFPKTGVSPYVLLAVLLSCPARLILSVRLGAGDDAPGSASRSYEVGL